jgi:hypothetical protein
MKKILVVMSLLALSIPAFAFQPGQCRNLPKRSCEKAKCKCERGIFLAGKGKQPKRLTNRRGKPTVVAVCYQAAVSGQDPYEALRQQKPKRAKKCGL